MTQGPRLQVEVVQTDDSTGSTQVIFDPATGNIAIDYSQYYERMASAVEDIRDVITGAKQVAGGGIPIRDAYAALSYSALIKVFEEENIDIDALIAKTKNKLSGL